MKKATTILLILTNVLCYAQMQRDQDLVTLKNGYQILGYVIEQEPGKLIRVYRPDENDTVVANMTEISKLTKIWVQTFAVREIEEKVRPDTLDFGRFNNKRNVFSINYTWQQLDVETKSRKGLGLAYYRSLNNRYWLGLSSTFFSNQNPDPKYSEMLDKTTRFEFSQIQIMFENKLRLSLRPQNKRVTTLLALNLGYSFDNTNASFEETNSTLDVEYEEYSGGFIFQTGLAMRVNPDNNSGFMIEPGYTLLPQNVKQYSSAPESYDAVYLGFRRQINHMLTFKVAYFF